MDRGGTWKKLPARRKKVPARQPLEAVHVVERVTVAAQACAQQFACLGGMDHATEAERKEDAILPTKGRPSAVTA